MASKVIMLKLSYHGGPTCRWLKKEGDKVSMGEPFAEIVPTKPPWKCRLSQWSAARSLFRKVSQHRWVN